MKSVEVFRLNSLKAEYDTDGFCTDVEVDGENKVLPIEGFRQKYYDEENKSDDSDGFPLYAFLTDTDEI